MYGAGFANIPVAQGLHLLLLDRRLVSVETEAQSLVGFFFSSKLRESRTQAHYSWSFFTVTKVYRDHLLILGEGTSCERVFKRQCSHVKTILLGYEVVRTWLQSAQAPLTVRWQSHLEWQ